MTIEQVVRAATERLAAAGIATPDVDAQWLVAHVLGVRRSAMVADGAAAFPDERREELERALERRADREPLAYVMGTAVFRGLELEVGVGCLVPRPETEITAERAIAHARKRHGRATVVDVGTGSGAIALAIAAEVPDARIFATEVSGAARGWALRNLARTGLRCTLLPGSLLSPLHPALGGCVDVVVSNPPYVSEGEWATLEPEVRRFEPKTALVGGPDGMEVVTELLEQVRNWIAPGGWIVLEVAPDQATRVSMLLDMVGYDSIEITEDLAGRARVVEGRWTGGR